LADRLLKRRTRAVAARARAVDSVGVAAPGAFLQLRQEAGHPHIPSWYFCTLDMSNAPGDSAHAHNSEETFRGARRAASTWGCRNTCTIGRPSEPPGWPPPIDCARRTNRSWRTL